ncbi:diguanylate cyclase [Malaciobacter mytili]|uniref:diguanylate cyclase n=1 Tax=Malaciobacter mytili TaxID=603050 RepID=UPI003BB13A5C
MKYLFLYLTIITFLFSKTIEIPQNNNVLNNLTFKEIEYLKNKKNILMCVDPNWMPLEKIENNKHIGMAAEYIKVIEKLLNIPILLVKTKTWTETLEFAKSRKCDIISLLLPTEQRAKYLDFPTAYLNIPLVIVTKMQEVYISEFSSLTKEIGIVKGYAFKEFLKKKHPNLNLVDVKNVQEGLQKVKEGKLFAFIDTVPTTGYYIQKKYFGELKISGNFDEILQLGIGTRNDEPILKDIFNKAISKISTEEHQSILNKWVAVKYEAKVDYLLIFRWIGLITLIFASILFIIMGVNKKLNKEIRKRLIIEKKLKDYVKLVDENIITSFTDLDGKIKAVSKAFCKVSKYSKRELIGKSHSIIKSKDNDKKVYTQLWESLNNNKKWEGELKNKAKDGSIYWVRILISPTFDENNKKIGYTSLQENITVKKRLEELSVTDELTQLYNKRFFNELLPKVINAAKRKDEYITFAMFDIDYFKLYNDTYGHLKGDEVLKKVSLTVKNSLHRADDYCFRLGGEEFGILFKDGKEGKAKAFIEKIKSTIENLKIEHKENTTSPYVTASFGVITLKASCIQDLEDLYKQTDKLLYEAKEKGRNKVCSN